MQNAVFCFLDVSVRIKALYAICRAFLVFLFLVFFAAVYSEEIIFIIMID
jgi:hypothetical protein